MHFLVQTDKQTLNLVLPEGIIQRILAVCLRYQPDHMNDQKIREPDVAEILRLASFVQKLFDTVWINEGIQKSTNPQGKNLTTHAYLYSPKNHPIIDLFIELERWRNECIQTGRFVLSQGVLRLYTLGSALEAAQNQDKFERISSRLKIPEQFLAAEFELEVAKSYLNRGYSVKFIEEGKNKTPDLYITGTNGKFFYVECKTKNLTERDLEQQKIIKGIEQRLLKFLGINRLNFFVAISLDDDLKFTDIEPLSKAIIDTMESLRDIIKKNKIINYSDRVKVSIENLTPHNIEVDANGITINSTQSPIHLTTLYETRRNEKGEIKMRNPKAIVFYNSKSSTQIEGLLKSLKKAASQLPKEGPGVVWIRIPDGMWDSNLEKTFKEAKDALQKELAGNKNRRINAAIIITKIFRKLKKDNLEGLAYTPVKLLIPHTNPRNST